MNVCFTYLCMISLPCHFFAYDVFCLCFAYVTFCMINLLLCCPRLLWSPDFPLIQEGIPLLPGLLDKADMQLSYHLFHTLGRAKKTAIAGFQRMMFIEE